MNAPIASNVASISCSEAGGHGRPTCSGLTSSASDCDLNRRSFRLVSAFPSRPPTDVCTAKTWGNERLVGTDSEVFNGTPLLLKRTAVGLLSTVTLLVAPARQTVAAAASSQANANGQANSNSNNPNSNHGDPATPASPTGAAAPAPPISPPANNIGASVTGGDPSTASNGKGVA